MACLLCLPIEDGSGPDEFRLGNNFFQIMLDSYKRDPQKVAPSVGPDGTPKSGRRSTTSAAVRNVVDAGLVRHRPGPRPVTVR
jgi:hypothetical protein